MVAALSVCDCGDASHESRNGYPQASSALDFLLQPGQVYEVWSLFEDDEETVEILRRLLEERKSNREPQSWTGLPTPGVGEPRQDFDGFAGDFDTLLPQLRAHVAPADTTR